MTRANLIKVITSELNNYCNDNHLVLVTENVSFDFDNIGEYLELFFIDAYNSDATLDGKYRLNGIAQINVNVPKNTGTKRILSVIEDLKNIYKNNGIINNSYGVVHLGSVYEDSNSTSNNVSSVGNVYYTIFLTVEYKEFT